MRSISAAGLAMLSQHHGVEPITVLEVDWTAGITKSYADRDVDGIPGRILEVGDLDNVISVSDNNSSQSLEVVLDDTDGSIKEIFNNTDIHKRDVRVYQHFHGLDLSDKFLLFAGKVSSPIAWNERDRTIRFTILSQLEDREIGFSAEEGQFPYLPADLVGKPWPMVFGTVRDCPALQINHAVQGTLLTGVGIVSGTEYYGTIPLYANGSDTDSNLAASMAQMAAQISTLWCARGAWIGVDNSRADDLLEQINDLNEQRGEMLAQAAQQQACARSRRQSQVSDALNRGNGSNPARILGGEDFPQNVTLTLEINGGQFTGHFEDDWFHIESRFHPEDSDVASIEASEREAACQGSNSGAQLIPYDYRIDVPCGSGGLAWYECECRRRGFVFTTHSGGTKISDDPILQQFWAEPGSSVRVYSDEPIVYIVSIVPGEVLAVKAYKQFDGYRRLVDVPTDLYTVRTTTYGSITAVELVFTKPLSSIKDQGWNDDVYVTFKSDVGPNTVDILKYIIDRWSDLTWDETSFNAVATKLEQFPMNFPILDRKNTLDVLQEIAYQARCALWISNGSFYLKYLPEEPAADDTITVSDIDAEHGVEVSLTPTEDLVTKMKIKWRLSWANGETDQARDRAEKWIILRHNVKRYGTHEEEYDWYCFNQPDIVLKSATFWLIRKSCTWKTIRFSTFLNKLNLETFDCVNLDFAGRYVADGTVKAIVLQANYNSADNLINFECLVPVKAGEMSQSRYYWPANLGVDETWPPEEDILSGDAGGGGIGQEAEGELPVGQTMYIDFGGTIWIGGPNIAFRPHSDYGDPRPTDVGFTPQTVIDPSVYGELIHTPRPRIRGRLPLLEPRDPQVLPALKGGLVLDLTTTKVIDSSSGDGNVGTLKSFFYSISGDGSLLLRSDAKAGDDNHSNGVPLDTLIALTGGSLALRMDATIHDPAEANPDASFDFRYDTEGQKYGAGTAFLKSN